MKLHDRILSFCRPSGIAISLCVGLLAILCTGCVPAGGATTPGPAGVESEPFSEQHSDTGITGTPSLVVLVDTVAQRRIAEADYPSQVRVLKIDGEAPNFQAECLDQLGLLADRQAVSAVLVSPAPRGSARLFQVLRQEYPSARLIALDPDDPVLEIEAAADLVVSQNPLFFAKGALLAAWLEGCTGLVALSAGEPVSGTLAEYRLSSSRLQSANLPLRFVGYAGPARSNGRAGSTPAELRKGLETSLAGLVVTKPHPPFPHSAVRTTARAGLPAPTPLPARLDEAQESGRIALLPLDRQAAKVAVGFAATNSVFPAGSILLAGLPGGPLEAALSGLVSAESQRELLAGIDSALAAAGLTGSMVLPVANPSWVVELALLDWAVSGDSALPDQRNLLGGLEAVLAGSGWQVDYLSDPVTGIRSRTHLLYGYDIRLSGRGEAGRLDLDRLGQLRP